MAKQKKPLEAVSGAYAAVPFTVLDSQAFIGASDRAKSLLFALLRQTNGSNNGRLQLTDKWLAARGWPSAGMNAKARDELLERGLIVQTRSGGLNAGCNWFALTWLSISNFSGLDVSANTYHKGAWNCCALPATARRKPPEKQKTHSDHRSSTTPTTGAVEAPTTPTTGAKTALFSDLTTPTTGNNVLHHYPPAQQGKGKRIVGKAGRSGKQTNGSLANMNASATLSSKPGIGMVNAASSSRRHPGSAWKENRLLMLLNGWRQKNQRPSGNRAAWTDIALMWRRLAKGTPSAFERCGDCSP